MAVSGVFDELVFFEAACGVLLTLSVLPFPFGFVTLAFSTAAEPNGALLTLLDVVVDCNSLAPVFADSFEVSVVFSG